jgi:hypothetical protein
VKLIEKLVGGTTDQLLHDAFPVGLVSLCAIPTPVGGKAGAAAIDRMMSVSDGGLDRRQPSGLEEACQRESWCVSGSIWHSRCESREQLCKMRLAAREHPSGADDRPRSTSIGVVLGGANIGCSGLPPGRDGKLSNNFANYLRVLLLLAYSAR